MRKNKLLIITFVVYFLLRVPHIYSPVTFEEISFSNGALYFRILSIILGAVSVYFFINFLNKIKLEPSIGFLLAISPWFIQINIFSVKSTTAILLFLICLNFSRSRWILFTLTLFIVLVVNINNLPKLYGQSIFGELNPKNYSWQIDTRLAEADVAGYGANRLVHNKATYFQNNLFINLMSPFNLERFSSPYQSYSPVTLNITNDIKLPKLFFFEVPLVLFGLIILLNKKSKILPLSLVALILSLLFNKNPYALGLMVPFYICFEGAALMYLTQRYRKLVTLLACAFVLAHISYHDIWVNHPNIWMGNEDFSFYKMSQSFKKEDLNKYHKIAMTDKLGDSKSYLSYYYGTKLNDKQINYGSFKYLETDRRDGDLWIGLPGEFVGARGDFNKDTEIDNGLIIKKIKNIQQPDTGMGNELWIVETKVNK